VIIEYNTINALVVQLVEALVLETRCWEFESLRAHQAVIAQLVELIENINRSKGDLYVQLPTL
jgi:hypothetical protein